MTQAEPKKVQAQSLPFVISARIFLPCPLCNITLSFAEQPYSMRVSNLEIRFEKVPHFYCATCQRHYFHEGNLVLLFAEAERLLALEPKEVIEPNPTVHRFKERWEESHLQPTPAGAT